jgi:hypothetical protein
MRLVHVSTRVAPYHPRRAEARVTAELPAFLGARGHEVVVVTVAPSNQIDEVRPHAGVARRLTPMVVSTPHGDVPVPVLEGTAEGGTGRVFLLVLPGGAEAVPSLFAPAALSLIRSFGTPPDVVHLHGSTGIEVEPLREQVSGVAVVSTVYDTRHAAPDVVAAIELADAVVVPFSDYASAGPGETEPSTVAQALVHRQGGRVVPHGIDGTRWDPLRDPTLPQAFGPHALAGKARCREALQRLLAFPLRADAPIIVVWSVPGPAAGGATLAELGGALTELDAQWVVIGLPSAGAPALALPSVSLREATIDGSDDRLLRLALAGADAVLLPDLSAALGQRARIVQRYGAVPVARRVQAHRDLLVEHDAASDTGGAFLFGEPAAAELYQALQRLRATFADRKAWVGLGERNAAAESGWGRTAALLEEIYRKTMDR